MRTSEDPTTSDPTTRTEHELVACRVERSLKITEILIDKFQAERARGEPPQHQVEMTGHIKTASVVSSNKADAFFALAAEKVFLSAILTRYGDNSF